MTQYIPKDAVVAEIEKLKKSHDNWSCMGKCFHQEYEKLLSFLDTLESKEVQEEPVSEDLEEAAEEWDESLYRSDAFKAGAKWKEQQIMKNAISTTVCYTMNAPSTLVSLPSGFEYGDKIKVIIIKSE